MDNGIIINGVKHRVVPGNLCFECSLNGTHCGCPCLAFYGGHAHFVKLEDQEK